MNGTFYKGYFLNGKKCGEGALKNLVKGKTMKGIWMDDSCATSILQDDVQDVNEITLQKCIPEVSESNLLCALLLFGTFFADWLSGSYKCNK